MDELYDEYNLQDDSWEIASEDSDDSFDDQSHIQNIPRYSMPVQTVRRVDSDSDEEEDTPTPPSFIISHSPPLDIVMRHPITNELSKREQYRREIDATSSDLSHAFAGQIENVLCHEIRYLSLNDVGGRTRLEGLTQQPLTLYA